MVFFVSLTILRGKGYEELVFYHIYTTCSIIEHKETDTDGSVNTHVSGLAFSDAKCALIFLRQFKIILKNINDE